MCFNRLFLYSTADAGLVSKAQSHSVDVNHFRHPHLDQRVARILITCLATRYIQMLCGV